MYMTLFERRFCYAGLLAFDLANSASLSDPILSLGMVNLGDDGDDVRSCHIVA